MSSNAQPTVRLHQVPASKSTRNGKYDSLVRPDGLVHRTLFTDPAIFQEEMTKIFGGTWVFLLHETEIPNPDDFKSITVGLRPVIVTRDSEGNIHALMNRCSHRGAMVNAEEKGNTKRFRCPYHGWNFNNNGELAAVPYADGYPDTFDKQAHNLGRFPRLESYRGYVFASLNADVEPLLEWIGPAKEVFDWSMDSAMKHGMRVVKSATTVFHGNWKMQNDNNGDMYHVPFTHRSVLNMAKERYGSGKSLDHFKSDDSPMYVSDLTHGHKLIDQRPSLKTPWDQAVPVPGRESYSQKLIDDLGLEKAREFLHMTGRAGINLILYPNIVIVGGGSFNVYEPVSVDKTYVHLYTVILDDAPPEMNTLRLRFAEDFVYTGNRDDNEVFERMQIALTTIPEMEWVDLSKGMGTGRESLQPDGSTRGNISDETGIRASYGRWIELMSSDIKTSVVF
ncbi:aromatic ring-hydroxylating dioxygenase subunit alpha [soil metagenome]